MFNRGTLFLIAPLFLAIVAAQPPKSPPVEDETGKAAKVKPPDLDKDPPPAVVAPAQGPGVLPGSGVLVVGVRQLPELLSPNFARTDAEKQALDLLFEGLVRQVQEMGSGWRYEPGLAARLPRVVGQGRAFEIIPDAHWAAPKGGESVPIVAADVLQTLERLKARGPKPGGELADWFGDSTSDATDRIRLTLRRGHPDPLSLMAFKILPANRTDDLTFAKSPLGSGPFTYSGRKTESGREYAVFTANPAYGKRSGAKSQPHLREIRFVVTRDPVTDFKSGHVDLLLDRSTQELAGLQNVPAEPVPGDGSAKLQSNLGSNARIVTVPGRRIHFLAVNHARVALGGESGKPLRRALAMAIERDEILTAVFRGGFKDLHKPLNGPFPGGTWASDPKADSLDQPALARGELRGRATASDKVTLKYADDDPTVASACRMIQQQLGNIAVGFTVDLKPLSPAEFSRQVEQELDYDLAYMKYDYPNYWLDPGGLLDARVSGSGSRNFLSLKPAEKFDDLVNRAECLREFQTLREAMHRLHGEFQQRMPFIPLWSLDQHLVLNRGLTTYPAPELLDPQAVFSFSERWRITR